MDSIALQEAKKPMSSLQLVRPGEVRVRIAPSPTGPFHIGSARTALFNYLFARKNQGSFILRIEDTDKERSLQEWEENVFDSLKWLGLDWDEGPDREGGYGPYRQSERREIYRKYLEQLLAEDKLYRCFCSTQDLEAYRQYLMSQGKPPVYSGKCRNLSEEQIKENLAKSRPFVLRFRTPEKIVVFEDILREHVEYDSTTFGDIVAAKDIASPLYNLACVIDDFEMKISHVIRGEEHISNTPRQILLAEALGIQPPQYLHLPLILNQKRAKLSKRDPDITAKVLDYKEQGYLPEALVNFLAFLGWNPGDAREIFSLPSLVQEFSTERLQRAGAVFNPQKLEWINGFYIRQKSLAQITELCLPYFIKAKLIEPSAEQKKEFSFAAFSLLSGEFRARATEEKVSFEYIKAVVGLYQERLKKISEIADLADFFFQKELVYDKALLFWKDADEKQTEAALDKLLSVLLKIEKEDWNKENLEKILLAEAEKFSAGKDKAGDRGKLLWPLRVALSGKQASAGPFEIAGVLGKEKTIERLREAKEKL